MSILETCLLSVILFGGASQIVFASWWPVQLRPGLFWHLLAQLICAIYYGLSIASYSKSLPLRWRILLAYLLTDEAYAMSIIRFRGGPNLIFCIIICWGQACCYSLSGRFRRLLEHFWVQLFRQACSLVLQFPLSFIAVFAL